jgi:hypothetical protein
MGNEPDPLLRRMYFVLKNLMPCACQYEGGLMWHFKAQAKVKKQCTKCRLTEIYEEQYPNDKPQP